MKQKVMSYARTNLVYLRHMNRVIYKFLKKKTKALRHLYVASNCFLDIPADTK